METMMKDARHEIFQKSQKATSNSFYCSTQSTNLNTSSSPTSQLLNRQKASNLSLKNLSKVESIELETTNDIYHFNSKNKVSRENVNSNNGHSTSGPMSKKEISQVIDSFRDSDYTNDTDIISNKQDKNKSLSFQGIDKQKPTNIKLKPNTNLNSISNNNTNTNSNTKLLKQKTDLSSNSNLLNNFSTNSLISTKIQCDKNKAKSKAKKEKNKDSKKKKNNSAVEAKIYNSVNEANLSSSNMVRTINNDVNNTKLNNIKINRQDSNANNNTFKSIIKKPNNNFTTNPLKVEKIKTPEKEDPMTLRWKYEITDNPDEENKRIDLYKQNRRHRYIDQRNKFIMISNSSTSFLPYLYYENDYQNTEIKKNKVREVEDEIVITENKDNITNLEDTDQNNDTILETTLTTDQEIPNLENEKRIPSGAASMNLKNKKIEEKKMENKGISSNVTTDSGISSLSSNSH